MAYLGVIGVLSPDPQPKKRASWIGIAGYTETQYLAEAKAGMISGTVKEDGVAKSGVWVYLLYRGHEAFGEQPVIVIDRVKSASDGTFSFCDLNDTKNCYLVIALDPEGGTQYNIARHDRITPV